MYYFCTLFDQNYLTRGLALYYSLRKNCPKFKLWILCMDDQTREILRKMDLPFITLVTLKEFENKGLLKAKANRTHQEYCWTCASCLLWYLFKKYPQIKLLSYLDADLYFYHDPEPIFTEMGNSSVLILPHRFEPEKRHFLVNGIYNVSLVSFRRDKNGMSCLRWWKDQCLAWCYYRLEEGKLGDQKYLDEFPKRFAGVKALSHLGAGLAHWNINQYKIWKEGKIIYVDGYPLIFIHFQGLKLPPPAFLLGRSVAGPYSRKSPYWELLYRSYIDQLYEMTDLVKKCEPGFSAGFIKIPLPEFYLRLFLAAAYRVIKVFSILAPQYKIADALEKIVIFVENVLSKFFNLLIYSKALISYLRQDECAKLSDCLLLWQIKSQQPPGSDRYIEYPWVLSHLQKIAGGKILDVGSSSCAMWHALLPKNFQIHAINTTVDPNPPKSVKFTLGDIRKTPYLANFFDTVICVSTLEHIGVAGRYGSDDDPEGDFKAMTEISRVTKPGGKLLVSVPYGRKDVLPINKLYDKSRLAQLLSGWQIEEQNYLKFDNRFGYWLPVSEKEAAKTEMIADRWYALTLIYAQKT